MFDMMGRRRVSLRTVKVKVTLEGLYTTKKPSDLLKLRCTNVHTGETIRPTKEVLRIGSRAPSYLYCRYVINVLPLATQIVNGNAFFYYLLQKLVPFYYNTVLHIYIDVSLY